MVYLICFCASTLLAYLAEKSRTKHQRILFSFLSVMITISLAGLRDYSIGIDTMNYYGGSWASAISSNSLWEFIQLRLVYSRERYEFLFSGAIWSIAKLTGDYHVYLFFVHLIIVGCVYIGAFRFEEQASPSFTLLLFYLLYYNHSLNISRQYAAMAILFAGAKDIVEGKQLRYFILVAIAFFVHNTSVIGLFPLLVYKVLYSNKKVMNASFFKRVLVVSGIIGTLVLFVPFMQFLINVGVLSKHYQSYILDQDNIISILVYILLAIELITIILCWKMIRSKNTQVDYFFFCTLAFEVLYLLSLSISYGKRVSAYFSFLNIISLGILVKYQNLTNNKRVVRILIIAAVLLYWLYFYAYKNNSQTMPYMLGI